MIDQRRVYQLEFDQQPENERGRNTGLIGAIALMQHRNVVIIQDGAEVYRTDVPNAQKTILLNYRWDGQAGHYTRLVRYEPPQE